MDPELASFDDCAVALVDKIESFDGDSIETRKEIDEISERIEHMRNAISAKKEDLLQVKKTLVQAQGIIDEAVDWSVGATARLSEIVASKPDLVESKQQIEIIEVGKFLSIYSFTYSIALQVLTDPLIIEKALLL